MPNKHEQLQVLQSLYQKNNHTEYLAFALALAQDFPAEVDVRLQAAYACDRFGTEAQAVVHYDVCRSLGVPEKEREEFLICYGSTLRNVGRLQESVAILEEAIEAFPQNSAARAFLGLALHSAGRHTESVAMLMEVALQLNRGGAGFDRFEVALAYYRTELLASVQTP